MLLPVRTLLAGLVGVALLVPAIGVAAARQEPPVTTPVETTPVETTPLPENPAPPVEPDEPPGQQTITLQVPPLPAPAAVAPKAKPKPKLVRERAPVRRVTPRRVVERVAEPETQARVDVAPIVKEKPRLKAKPTKPSRPQQKVIAPASAPQRLLRDGPPTHGVLAAQFPPQAALSPSSTPDSGQRAVLYLALVLGAVLVVLLGLVGTAPVLALRWPQVFVPVIHSSERIVLAGVCLATGALTLAITWVLTGPGA